MEFRRDRATWLAYGLLGWFAYFQASPGLVVPNLREELGLGYAVAGLHVTAFAAGGVIAGLTAARLEGRIGRGGLLRAGAAGMAASVGVLVAGRTPGVTLAGALGMGALGGLLLVGIQAVLSDRHCQQRTVALAEANVVASLGYLAVSAALAVAAALTLGWRAALLAVVAVPALTWSALRSLGAATASAPPHGRPPATTDRRAHAAPDARPEAPAPDAPGRRHGPAPGGIRAVSAVLFFGTAADWCLSAWGVSFVRDATGAGTDAAVAAMAAYFAGMVAGRAGGSVLARRVPAARLLGLALAGAAAGVAVLWTAPSALVAAAGLAVAGLGTGNLYPLSLALAIGLEPERAAAAGGRAVVVASTAVVLIPLALGRLADATGIVTALGVVPLCLALSALALVASPAPRARAAPA